MKKIVMLLMVLLISISGCLDKKTPKDKESYSDKEVMDNDAEINDGLTDESIPVNDNDVVVVPDDDTDDGWGGEDDPDNDIPVEDNNVVFPDENQIPDEDEDSIIEFTGSSFSYKYNGTATLSNFTALDGDNTIKFKNSTLPVNTDGKTVVKFIGDFDEILFSFSEEDLNSLKTIQLDGKKNSAIWKINGEVYGSFSGTVKKVAFSKTGIIYNSMEINGTDLVFTNADIDDPENDEDSAMPDDNEFPDLDPEDYSDFSFLQTGDSYSGHLQAVNEESIIKFTASSKATLSLASCPKNYCFSATFSSAYGTVNFKAAINTDSMPATIDLENDGYSYLRWISGSYQYGHFIGLVKVFQFEEGGFPNFGIDVLDSGSDSLYFIKDVVIQDLDSDKDGTKDIQDGCPFDAKKIQAGICGCGVSDSDEDFDDLLFCNDNCPDDYNLDQKDTDSDGKGDACDTDIDGDEILNSSDNCVYDQNTNQQDTDNDGKGNICDADIDGDDVLNEDDNCPINKNPNQLDEDGDNTGDVCDQCPIDSTKILPGVCNCGTPDIDSDFDGVLDCKDNCPLIYNKSQLDSDSDSIGDACDNTPYTPDN